MRTHKLYFTAIAILLTFTSTALPQSGRSAQTKIIDTYVRSIDKYIEGKGRQKIVVADVSGQDDKKAKWRRFASEKALEKYREGTETYTIAYNWKRAGRTVASNFTMFSGSGDWAQYDHHYFRPDGSAAYIKSELRTFYGDYIVIRERYFDSRGKLLRKQTRYLDLTTHKPKKPTDEMLSGGSIFSPGATYKKASKLPFARLLK